MQQKAKLIDISKICIYIDFVQSSDESAKSNSTNKGSIKYEKSGSNGKSTADVDTQSVASFDTYDMRRSKRK